jgi:5-formyltetrahydrofolate cyclo-ligase
VDQLHRKKSLLRSSVKKLNAKVEVSIDQLSSHMTLTSLGLFRPLRDEPDLVSPPEGVSFFWPYVKDEKRTEMAFSKSDQGFVKNSLGFEEPESKEEYPKNQLSAVLVPGLAFDFKGGRLGRGKGYYDRFLSDYQGLKVGVCSADRFLNDVIPVDQKFDVAVEYILTEQFLYKVNPFTEVV